MSQAACKLSGGAAAAKPQEGGEGAQGKLRAKQELTPPPPPSGGLCATSSGTPGCPRIKKRGKQVTDRDHIHAGYESRQFTSVLVNYKKKAILLIA